MKSICPVVSNSSARCLLISVTAISPVMMYTGNWMMMRVDESTFEVRCTCCGDQLLPAAFPLNLSLCVFSIRLASACQEMDTCNQGNQWAESKLIRKKATYTAT